jgi:hypothetical protein
MPDTPHRYAVLVELAILDLLLQIARFPLSHFSEKSLQVRLSAKLLANEELATPVPTDVQHRYRRNLELICEEEGRSGRDLKTFLDQVYHVPPLQMEYGRGEQRRIDVAILAPDDIRGICDPLKFQVEDAGYITPLIGVEFGTEKTGWHEMPAHLSKDGSKLLDCKHGYSVSVMRNANFGRRSLKGAAAKEETVAVFRDSLREHALSFPTVKWIGIVINLAFGDVDCFTQSGEWVRCDIAMDVNNLVAPLRTILTFTGGSFPAEPDNEGTVQQTLPSQDVEPEA